MGLKQTKIENEICIYQASRTVGVYTLYASWLSIILVATETDVIVLGLVTTWKIPMLFGRAYGSTSLCSNASMKFQVQFVQLI